MPPKTRFTPDAILDAAIELTRADGVHALTARAVAAQLGSSTAPIFSNFGGMEALHEQLIDRIITRFVEATDIVRDEDPMISAGLGMVRFAAEEPRLYEALFLTHHPYHFKWGRVRRQLAQRMSEHPRYAHLSDRARFGLVGRSSIIVHGLGVEVWSGRLEDPSEQTLRMLLDQIARPVIDAALEQGWTDEVHTAKVPASKKDPDTRTPTR